MYLCLTTVSLSSIISISLLAVASSLGGLISKLKWLPVVGSTLLLDSLLILSSSGYSKRQTSDGLILSDFKRLIYASVCGKPSRIQPLTLQSLYFSLCSTNDKTMLSGTKLPESKH